MKTNIHLYMYNNILILHIVLARHEREKRKKGKKCILCYISINQAGLESL